MTNSKLKSVIFSILLNRFKIIEKVAMNSFNIIKNIYCIVSC